MVSSKRINLDKALKCVIIAQCFGLTSGVVFGNGFMASWFEVLGIESAEILFILALPSAVGAFSGIPAAYWADRKGKLFVGNLGSIISALGLGVLALPAFFDFIPPKTAAYTGVFFSSLGGSIFGSSWFGLIGPIIPKSYRGRFLGNLRISWQFVNIVLSLTVVQLLASHKDNPMVFGWTLLVVMCLVFMRTIPYLMIPERPDRVGSKRTGIIKSTRTLMACKTYRNFVFYLFIYTFLTGSFVNLAKMIQIDVLKFDKSVVVGIGTTMFVGSIAGFYIGAQIVDKLSAFTMFLTGQIVSAILMILMSFHQFLSFETILVGTTNLPETILVGTILFLFGLIGAAVGIASSAHLFAVMPHSNRSMGTTLAGVGTALALFLSTVTMSKITEICGIFPVQNYSIYDILTLILGVSLIVALPAIKLLKK